MGQFQLKPSFAGGELTPALYGRTDLQKYDVGAAVLENAIVQRYGGVTRRPGFRHVEQTAANKKARLIPFSYNAEQNYVIELTDKKARVYANGEILKIDNTIVEVATPYTEAELSQIKYTQSADMLFLCHPNHHPASLTRTLTDWIYETLEIESGPFDDPNITETTLKPGATTSPNTHCYTNVGKAEEPFFGWGETHTSDNLSITETGYYVNWASWARKTSIQNTKFPRRSTKDIWIRMDICKASNVSAEPYPVVFMCYFDNTAHTIGLQGRTVHYRNALGAYVTQDLGAAPIDEVFKTVVHIGREGVEVYESDVLVFSVEAFQGQWITAFKTATNNDKLSNIIISDFDCSNMTLVEGDPGDPIPDGTIELTASENLFTEDMVGQLIRIGHTVPSEYKKDVPGGVGADLTVRCVPGASVYVESFGFWEGDFEVSRQDDFDEWTPLKKQSGNRSSNYNMTFQNDEDVIKTYKVDSDNFDNSVHGDEDPDQRGYVTIQSFSNDYDGIVRVERITDAKHARVTVIKELGATTETLDWSLQAWSIGNGYPQAVGFFEDRLVFAGSPKKPQTYWASKTGDYLNFGTSYPGKDDDAITGTLASGKMNAVKAIVPFGEMVMLTTGGEYRVSGGNGQNFTPTTQQARAQEYRGITDVPPVIIGGRILYVQRGGSIIRDLAYSYDVDKYTGDEVSILASHLFDGYEIIGMAYQQTPESVLWCVRSDGVLLGLTYIKEQDVYAWHRHTTQGQFVDVCSIPGEVEDELWVCVKRGNKYFVEQLTRQEDNVYVDAAGIYNGTARNNVQFTWLSGETVQVLGDGFKLEEHTVSSSGWIVDDLEGSFSSIIEGLGYDTTVTTLPIEMNGQDGTWGSRKKRIQNICVMFKDTLGGRFGFNGKPLDEIKWRSTEPYGTAVQAYTGKKKVTLPQANYEDTLMLTIKQPDPFPMTILSIIPEILPGG